MRRLIAAAMAGAAILYLRDPAWVGQLTSGLRPWEEDPPGTRFRWTAGRASFFIPAETTAMTVPMRAVFPARLGGATDVQVLSDGRWLATVRLPDPEEWVKTTLPIGGRTTRRFRRIDLHVNHVVPPFMLGVMVGEVTTSSAQP